jgi:hypothetical protein
LTTSHQTKAALNGTEMYRLMPKISRLAATPANSEIVFPRLARNSRIIR